ncbi:MAG TPA: SAM-dependent methyltransferase [Aeromonadales bacterium]|nr:SAM-dependent methyltransferase [Aeromonadales bacterium]
MTYQKLIKNQLKQLGRVPEPGLDAIAHSEKLNQHLLDLASKNNNSLTFSLFMENCLYAPGLGYYSAGAEKIGESGDFITAPEISPLFSEALAAQIAQVLEECKKQQPANILEFGAGRGVMAVDILSRLQQMDCLPETYYILEVSADLKQTQQNTIKQLLPQLSSRVKWISTLPEHGFNGVMLANEVVDAMPVTVFKKEQGQFKSKDIVLNEGQWQWQINQKLDQKLQQWGEKLEQRLGYSLPEGYESEVNQLQSPWLEALSDNLQKGMILLVDYGFPEKEYYHPQRPGTLMCHYRHFSHSDPLVLLGLQDITAHVDFTALAETVFQQGLQVAGYTDQGTFLTNCGILERMELLGGIDDEKIARHSQQIKLLILPTEMGELFKVIAFTKNLDSVNLLGFIKGDRRSRL